MFAELFGVIRDAAVSLDPQPLAWPRGEAGTIVIYIRRASDGSVFDTTGCTAKIAIKPKGTVGAAAGPPIIARLGNPLVAGDGTIKISLVEADTLAMQEGKSYRFDVHFTDNTSARSQIICESDFVLMPTVGLSSDPASAP